MAVTATAVALEVFDAAGRRLLLRGPGRSGGEGTVYAIEGQPLSLAKIFHTPKVAPELRNKIAAMRATPPRDAPWETQRHRSIAWVQQLLFHDPGRTRFAGFTMPRIDTDRFREAHLYFDPQDRIRRFGGGFTWRHLLAAATNVASAVAAVHAEGHRVGDLRETNVLVGPSALIALIDCDSFQIGDPVSGRVFHCRVGTADFLPRELHGADFRRDIDRTHADLFALGVMIFKLLMEGVHPYQARGRLVDGAPSTEAKIKRGVFPYERRWGAEPPPFAPPYENVPPRIRSLFRRCFVTGHRRPAKRPSASEWFAVLREEGKRLRTCASNPSHSFGSHLRSCPWCALASARGVDLFPPPGAVGKQVMLAPPSPRAPRVSPKPRQQSPAAPARRPAWRRTLSRVRRIRFTKRRTILVLSVSMIVAALAGPLGHASDPVRRTPVAWTGRASGPCPFDPAGSSAAVPSCRGSWNLGPVTKIEQRSRAWFVLRRETQLLRVAFEVRFSSRAGCELPWIGSRTFNERAVPVCFGTCPERIELRGPGRSVYPMVDASGIAARAGPLRCGTTYRGSWTFDTKQARGRLRLHHPAFAELALPARSGP